ncbi:MAG: acetylglutamate kinase [Chloroflexi bacterium]|nr:acetylglutamate kinase [Chloroflexota bacterium]
MPTSPTSRPLHVIKIGGSQIDDRAFLARMVQTIVAIRRQGIQPVIVHGGGPEIVRLHNEMSVSFEVVEGLRATSEQSLRLVKMALNGIANLRVVRYLINGGIEAIGLNGIDLGLVRVEKQCLGEIDLGRVGRVKQVHAHKLAPLLAADIVPVISPISLGMDGLSYNVNADHIAEALAIALQAAHLVFITDVPGILIAGQLMRLLPCDQIDDLIAGQFINGGMIPKTRAARAAVMAGVPSAMIGDLDHYQRGEGTHIVREN